MFFYCIEKRKTLLNNELNKELISCLEYIIVTN